MAVTKRIDCNDPTVTLEELYNAAFVKKTSDGVEGLRSIVIPVAESALTPMKDCDAGANLSIEEIQRRCFQMTTDGKVAFVFYEAESTT